ncbi:MAG TPA: type II CAAX endopeptidase family protein [Pyrinomonadaceae bacterium]
MDIRTLLFDRAGRLRSGWRFLIFCGVFIVAALLIGGAGFVMLSGLGSPLDIENPVFFIANGVLLLIAALLAGWLCGKYLEGLPFRALGASFTDGWLRHLIDGILFGAATLTLAVLIAAAGGGLQFETRDIETATLIRSLAVSLIIFAAGAAWEEALFRGYILQTFARSGLAALAIGLTSVLFGAIHADNENVSTFAVINTMLAGIWFGVAYLKTRDLWFVWGMHLMWNWMQGAFFGIEVSGTTHLVSSPLLREIDGGPSWLTGETYGVEGGIVATIAIIVSTIVIYFMPSKWTVDS